MVYLTFTWKWKKEKSDKINTLWEMFYLGASTEILWAEGCIEITRGIFIFTAILMISSFSFHCFHLTVIVPSATSHTFVSLKQMLCSRKPTSYTEGTAWTLGVYWTKPHHRNFTWNGVVDEKRGKANYSLLPSACILHSCCLDCLTKVLRLPFRSDQVTQHCPSITLFFPQRIGRCNPRCITEVMKKEGEKLLKKKKKKKAFIGIKWWKSFL